MDNPPAKPIDLLSLCLTLEPLAQPDLAAPLPAWWGRAAHALLLRVAGQFSPALAAELHNGARNQDEQTAAPAQNPVRPFTVSSLIGRFPNGALDAQRPYTLRFTALRGDLAAMLLQAAQPGGPLAKDAEIELDRRPFRVLAAPLPGETDPVRPTPWSAAAAYHELAAQTLLSPQPRRRFTLLLASPTAFKSGGKHLPFPLPELVFGSLLDRWNAYAPVVFPAEARRYAAECLAVARYDLETRPAYTKGGGMRVGAVGSATYTALTYDRYWLGVLEALATFAVYSGVGAGTSMGLGQCRLDAGEA